MRHISLVLSALLLLLPCTCQADASFLDYSAIRHEAGRLGQEAADVVTTPFDLENGGIWGTVGVAAATALVYTFDNDIHDKVSERKGDTLDKAAKGGSLIGNPFVHLGIAAAVYGAGSITDTERYREMGLMMGEAAVLADASTFVLKSAVGRARPIAGSRSSFRSLQFSQDFDSFPSMHTASSFAMASVIAGTTDDLATKVASYAAALFVGFSRIYEEKHWASDVVFAAALGELCGRVVMGTHAKETAGLRIAPLVSMEAVSLAVVGKW